MPASVYIGSAVFPSVGTGSLQVLDEGTVLATISTLTVQDEGSTLFTVTTPFGAYDEGVFAHLVG